MLSGIERTSFAKCFANKLIYVSAVRRHNDNNKQTLILFIILLLNYKLYKVEMQQISIKMIEILVVFDSVFLL
ncbi:MAG TPA: hypothetical protein DEQ02_02575 [Ruminococcaceae bacterium]|nr:hypothetical protein [Oscillospiraceae bacterium]